ALRGGHRPPAGPCQVRARRGAGAPPRYTTRSTPTNLDRHAAAPRRARSVSSAAVRRGGGRLTATRVRATRGDRWIGGRGAVNRLCGGRRSPGALQRGRPLRRRVAPL